MKKLTLALILLAGPALAHPGHAAAPHEGALHWLTETDHLVAVLATVAAAFLLRMAYRRAQRD